MSISDFFEGEGETATSLEIKSDISMEIAPCCVANLATFQGKKKLGAQPAIGHIVPLAPALARSDMYYRCWNHSYYDSNPAKSQGTNFIMKLVPHDEVLQLQGTALLFCGNLA